ncbi:hypothetical protein VTN00DRAFT_3792 [Thermoascus crustaceus]|uniref:uncharacterized protein n=1 Tax=Thermoascus crustaceus TaxID=5088 RepID=UPI003742C031
MSFAVDMFMRAGGSERDLGERSVHRPWNPDPQRATGVVSIRKPFASTYLDPDFQLKPVSRSSGKWTGQCTAFAIANRELTNLKEEQNMLYKWLAVVVVREE